MFVIIVINYKNYLNMNLFRNYSMFGYYPRVLYRKISIILPMMEYIGKIEYVYMCI